MAMPAALGVSKIACRLALVTVVLSVGAGPQPAAAGSGMPGDSLWVATYNGPDDTGDQATSLTVSPDGTRVYVTGAVNGLYGTSRDYGTLAYDTSTGAPVWTRLYNGPGDSTDYPTSVAVDPDGQTVFVAGYSNGGETASDFATIAYEAETGAQLWLSRYDGPGGGADTERSMALSPDGARLYVTGETWATLGHGFDYATIAYDAGTGEMLWVRRYNGPSSRRDAATSVAVSPDGGAVFVTGYSWGSTSYDYATLAYDAVTGQRLWLRRYNGYVDGPDVPTTVAVSPEGSRVFVTGTGGPGQDDYVTIAHDAATGRKLWIQQYDGTGKGFDYGQALAVSPDGAKVLVTGYSWGDGRTNYDCATVAYDAATGSQSWVQRYNGPPGDSYDVGESLAMSPNGTTVFVGGYSDGGESFSDYATLAYNLSSGSLLWASRLNGSENGYDYAFAIAANPDGTAVYVAGSTEESLFNDDYTTVAYATS